MFDSACSFLVLCVALHVAHVQIKILQELSAPCKRFTGPDEKVGIHIPNVTTSRPSKSSNLVLIFLLHDTY